MKTGGIGNVFLFLFLFVCLFLLDQVSYTEYLQLLDIIFNDGQLHFWFPNLSAVTATDFRLLWIISNPWIMEGFFLFVFVFSSCLFTAVLVKSNYEQRTN